MMYKHRKKDKSSQFRSGGILAVPAVHTDAASVSPSVHGVITPLLWGQSEDQVAELEQ